MRVPDSFGTATPAWGPKVRLPKGVAPYALPAPRGPHADGVTADPQAAAKTDAAAEAFGVKPAKYRNRKVTFDGMTFDSKKELKRWLELRLEERAGRITNLRRQVPFPLVVNGEPICEYVADAVYERDGVLVVEDTKSPVTRKLPVYRLKRGLMRAIHRVEILET